MNVEKPLFTFFVYAFNQEKFIREAIAGALSQTYTPLEIILSDDCSSDKTWAIMQEMAANYKGPNSIILNRNKTNLGITAHLNRIMQLGNGDWFILGAGDDISLPDRVQIVYEAIEKHPNAYGVATALMDIDENGEEIRYHNFDVRHPYVTGASFAWHRKCFEFFGEITQPSTAEDVIIPFRSVLLGELLLIKIPTVKYRSHEQSISNPINLDLLHAWKHVKKIKYQLINACKQRLLDLEKATQLVSPSIYEKLELEHNKLIKNFETDIENINLRNKIWESNLIDKITYLIYNRKQLPDKHSSFFYRLRTFAASFKWAQYVFRNKNSSKKVKLLKQEDHIRSIKAQDLLDAEVGLLMYL